MNEIFLLLLMPIVWTGPIPHPDCVEIVDESTVILHAEPTVIGCETWFQLNDNQRYYERLGYNQTHANLHVIDPSKLIEQGTVTMEKTK